MLTVTALEKTEITHNIRTGPLYIWSASATILHDTTGYVIALLN